ncbi:hypothetical protein BDW22DRAFT_764803 [Trametopsis cervina]|nr:hypothetical protein BDW22DRAFT_764803 [Trametopsis cervina]
MVNWQSDAELAVDAAAFAKLMHALAGVYFWEFATSLDFDWSYISGKRKFTWPMIFYFLDRYFLFFAMIGILMALDITTEINCQALYTFDQLAGDGAVGLASINLAIRTMALWSQSLYIVVPIVCIIIGHWVLILQGILLKAVYIPGTGCAIIETKTTILAATFIYSMCFDLIILILTSIKLAKPKGGQRSQLMTMLFRDGLIYFLIAFMANLLATVFMVMNLNAVMSVIFNVPAAIASTIVACRAVRRLQTWQQAGAEVFSSNQAGSQIVFRSTNAAAARSTQAISMPHGRKVSDGVHVQMDTFAVSEHGSDGTSKQAPYDIEDPEISADFKRPPY